MSFLMQHVEGLVLIVLGLVIFVGFLQQFGVVQGRGLIALVAGVAALFGWSLFQNARKQRIREEIEAKRAELDQQEDELEALQDEYELSTQQLEAQRRALADRRRMYLKRLAEIEAANEEELNQRLTEIENTPPDELADQLTRLAFEEEPL
jgi:septal ring factor EnvC (AmiA/AmiB activator)